jgi:outer membrane protein TolC
MRLAILTLPMFAIGRALLAEPGLPDEALVAAALSEHPSIVAADERIAAAEANSEARAVGPYEFTVSGSYNRRYVTAGQEFDEYSLSLQRPFRLPGKVRLDREIGAYEVDAAKNLAEDARHQAALILNGYWWDWLGAAATARIDAQAVTNYEAALAAMERRVALDDAAPLDADQARAALAAAKMMAEQSRGQEGLARARLAVQFPALALPPEAPEIGVPQFAETKFEALREDVTRNSHEIAAAEAQARQGAASARRITADRFADPTFGVQLFSEFGGLEKGAGVTLSIPFGGRRRASLAREAEAHASAALAAEQLTRREVAEVAAADFAEVNFRFAAWERARTSLSAQMDVLAKLRRGHELGEIDLDNLLLGERMVHEAFRVEVDLRAAAQRAITRLRIDAHDLWLKD